MKKLLLIVAVLALSSLACQTLAKAVGIATPTHGAVAKDECRGTPIQLGETVLLGETEQYLAALTLVRFSPEWASAALEISLTNGKVYSPHTTSISKGGSVLLRWGEYVSVSVLECQGEYYYQILEFNEVTPWAVSAECRGDLREDGLQAPFGGGTRIYQDPEREIYLISGFDPTITLARFEGGEIKAHTEMVRPKEGETSLGWIELGGGRLLFVSVKNCGERIFWETRIVEFLSENAPTA